MIKHGETVFKVSQKSTNKEGTLLKLRYIAVFLLAALTISFFGCVPEEEKREPENDNAEVTTIVLDSTTAEQITTSGSGGGVFGDVQEYGTLPSISFDEFK